MGARAVNQNGIIVYHGPSRIDGAPIVAVATGFQAKSDNGKTGDMLQTWILRADVPPLVALRTGADASICGGCEHRYRWILTRAGKRKRVRSCYVNVGQAPRAVWQSFNRGNYARAVGAELSQLCAGRVVRLGSYGDPAAVPLAVWDACLARAAGWTGYTHQARSPKLRDVLKYCQVSADSCDDARAAHRAGVGSFRVLRAGESPEPFEMLCPASAEAGRVSNCASCQACKGWEGANVAIHAHGAGRKHYAMAPATRRGLSLPILNTRSA